MIPQNGDAAAASPTAKPVKTVKKVVVKKKAAKVKEEKPENGENGDADSTAKVKENGENGDADSTATVILDDKPLESPCDESVDKCVQGEPFTS